MQWITGTYLPTTRAFRIPVPTVSHSIGVSQPPPAGDASLGVKQHSSWLQHLLQNQERKTDASDNPIWVLWFVFKEMNQEMQGIKNELVKELNKGWCEKPSGLFSSEIPPRVHFSSSAHGSSAGTDPTLELSSAEMKSPVWGSTWEQAEGTLGPFSTLPGHKWGIHGYN